MKHFVPSSFYFGPKNGSPFFRHGNSLVVRRLSPGRIIDVFFGTKFVVPRPTKPRILKLPLRRGQGNFSIFFTSGSCSETGNFRVVSVGQLSFDCRSFCGLRLRMQGRVVASVNSNAKPYCCCYSSNHLKFGVSWCNFEMFQFLR